VKAMPVQPTLQQAEDLQTTLQNEEQPDYTQCGYLSEILTWNGTPESQADLFDSLPAIASKLADWLQIVIAYIKTLQG